MRPLPVPSSPSRPRQVEIALTVALIVTAAGGAWRLASPPDKPVHRQQESLSADPGALTRVDAFFSAGAPVRAEDGELGLAGWRLTATRTGGDASAILQRPDGVQTSHRMGEDVGDGLILRAVGTDHVILASAGREHRLGFTQEPPRPPAPPDGVAQALSPDAARAASEMGVSAPQQDAYASTLRPQMKNGTVEGFVWRRGGTGGALAAVGLREGDVILSVDGEPLTSQERVHELDGVLSSGRPVEIRYRRGGQILTATLAPRTDG